MNKHDVMKALALCAGNDGIDDCHKCPYFGMPECDKRLNEDAIAFLESEPWYDDKPTYEMAIIYTKHTNLMPWLQSNYTKFSTHGTTEQVQCIRAAYEKDRDVQLILLVRHEDGKCICRIKCPINPLPIKGEFQCVSTGEMSKLLKSMGWTYKEKVHSGMFA